MIETVTVLIPKVIKVWVEDNKVFCEAADIDAADNCPLMDEFGKCPFRDYNLGENIRAEREKGCFDAQ